MNLPWSLLVLSLKHKLKQRLWSKCCFYIAWKVLTNDVYDLTNHSNTHNSSRTDSKLHTLKGTQQQIRTKIYVLVVIGTQILNELMDLKTSTSWYLVYQQLQKLQHITKQWEYEGTKKIQLKYKLSCYHTNGDMINIGTIIIISVNVHS